MFAICVVARAAAKCTAVVTAIAGSMPLAVRLALIFEAICLAFWRRFFSPAEHRWQKLQSTPLPQPLVWKKAQGLQLPNLWPAEPTVGIALVPSSESGKDSEMRSCGACAGGGGAKEAAAARCA